jgi:flagellar basal body-associated protein FliL
MFSEIWGYAILFAQRTVPVKKAAGGVDFWTVVALIIGFTVVIAVGFIAYYVVSKLKHAAKEAEQPPSLSEHLTKFEEARNEGSMTPQEYAAVKAHLSQEIMREFKQNDSDNTPIFRPK